VEGAGSSPFCLANSVGVVEENLVVQVGQRHSVTSGGSFNVSQQVSEVSHVAMFAQFIEVVPANGPSIREEQAERLLSHHRRGQPPSCTRSDNPARKLVEADRRTKLRTDDEVAVRGLHDKSADLFDRQTSPQTLVNLIQQAPLTGEFNDRSRVGHMAKLDPVQARWNFFLKRFECRSPSEIVMGVHQRYGFGTRLKPSRHGIDGEELRSLLLALRGGLPRFPSARRQPRQRTPILSGMDFPDSSFD
jgi:hypothetical protein